MVVKIVHDELQVLLGEEDARIHFKKQGMTTVMMVGLQGTGKTTKCKDCELLQKQISTSCFISSM